MVLPLDIDALFAPIARQRAIGLAVSGGADSLALMLLAAKWARKHSNPPAIFVYTLDHGLRPEAREEAGMVAAEARRLGLVARVLRWDGEKPQSGVQAAARKVRYRLIGEAMAEDGVEVLLTAHHAGDQAETVLMRLAHGSGLAGLAGMHAFSRIEGIEVFRPLLDVPPQVLRDIVGAAGLSPASDPSNFDPAYERVRWRNMLPDLAELGLDLDAIGRFARRAREAEMALEAVVEEAFGRLVAIDKLGTASLEREQLLAQPKAIGIRLLQKLLAETGGYQRPYLLGQVELLHANLVAPGFGKQTLAGCVIRASGPLVWFAREPGRQQGAPAAICAGQSLQWDDRFIITNGSGRTVIVQMASSWNRRQAEALIGMPVAGPIEGLRSSPLTTDQTGEKVLALGGYELDPAIVVQRMKRA